MPEDIGQTSFTKPLWIEGFRLSHDDYGLESGGEGGQPTTVSCNANQSHFALFYLIHSSVPCIK